MPQEEFGRWSESPIPLSGGDPASAALPLRTNRTMLAADGVAVLPLHNRRLDLMLASLVEALANSFTTALATSGNAPGSDTVGADGQWITTLFGMSAGSGSRRYVLGCQRQD
jgi:hypothetical protein